MTTVADRVRETTSTTGTGTLSLIGAVTDFRAFSAAFADGTEVYYCIELPGTGAWEVGIGTYNTGTLSRDTVLASSNAGALVSFAAGVKNVFCTLPGATVSPVALTFLKQTTQALMRSTGLGIGDGSQRNLLYNGAWLLDQVDEGALYTVAGGAGAVQLMDGWSGQAVGAGTFKVRRLIDPDDASLMCAEVSCTTADASLAATDNYIIWTAIEGNDVRDLKCGQADAKQVKLSFKVKSNAVTGDFGVFFRNSAGDRYYPTTFNIAAANEQDASVAVVTLDTTGTWLKTNGIGLQLGICLAAGSNFQGTADAWTASAIETTASQANFMSANTNILYIKRIKLEQGTIATPWHPDDMDYAKVLAKGQRYYEKGYPQEVAVGTAGNEMLVGGLSTDASTLNASILFKVEKRGAPASSVYAYDGTSGSVTNYNATGNMGATGCAWVKSGTSGLFVVTRSGGTTFTAGNSYWFQWVANARLS